MSESGRILIVDDEDSIRESLAQILHKCGHSIVTCHNGPEALQHVRHEDFDLVITDLKMEGMDGINVLERIKMLKPEILVIIMTGYASLDSAIASIRKGAFDYLIKPFQVESLKLLISRSIEMKRLTENNTNLLKELKKKNKLLGQTNKKLKKTQKKLLEAERLTAITETIATIHHEINNPLTAILCKIQLMVDKSKNGTCDLSGDLLFLEDRTLKVAEIIEKLKSISKPCSTEYVDDASMLDLEQST
ncbi:response regulator [bacterium]|nr:response regulator [bacterium]